MTTMQTSTVSSGQAHTMPGSHALLALLLAGISLAGVSNRAHADDGQVVLSTGIGAIAGALIGQSIGGRNATIVGGALGAAIGASAATQGNQATRYRNGPPPGYYRGGYQGGYNAYPPVQVVQTYRPAPVVYAPVYQPVYRPGYQPYARPYVRPYVRGYVRQTVQPVVYPRYDRDDNRGGYDSDDRGEHGERNRRGWDRNGDGDRDGHQGRDHQR